MLLVIVHHMNKKYLKFVKSKDYYKFQKLLFKDGDYIFDAICERIGESGKCAEKLYDVVIMKIWNYTLENDILKKNLSEYIEDGLTELKEEIEDNTDYSLDIAMDDLENEKILNIRKKVFRNQRVIGKIIVKEFKKDLGIEETIYEKLINTINVTSRYRDYYGNFGKKSISSSSYYFYVVVITEESIHFKPLTIKYGEIANTEFYNSNRFDDIECVKVMKSKIKNIPGPLIIKFKNGKEIEFKYLLSTDMAELKKFLKELFIEKGMYGLAG